jgi:hypothetical protein
LNYLEPPNDLTDAQATLWRAIVATKPPEWFSADTGPILKQYCRLTTRLDETAAKLQNPEPKWGRDDLIKTEERLSRSLMALARSMRLTQQSRIDPKTAATAHHRAITEQPSNTTGATNE